MTAVGDILELAYGKALKASDRHGGPVPVVGSGGVVGGHSNGLTDSPTIVVGRKGSIGSVTWIDGPAWPIDTAYFVKPRRDDLDRRWAYWMLKSLGMENMNKSAAVPGLNRDDVYRLHVDVPPLAEQRRIAAILDHADALRARRQGLRGLYLELIESQFDRHTRGASEVTIATLLREGALAVHKDGNHGSVYPRAEEFGSTGVPFLTAKAIRDDGTFITEAVDHLSETKARQLRVGWIRRNDVLLSHNASVGKVAVYEGQFGEALIGTSLTSFRSEPSLLDPRFLAASLRSSFFQRQLTSNMAQTTRNQVPITAQRELRVKWAGLDQQRAFVKSAEQINARLRDEWRTVAACEELFASLQSRAFRGEL